MGHITAAAPRFILRFLELQRLIDKHSLELNGARILEIGPGLGDVASWVSGSFKVEAFDLVEASPVARSKLVSRFEGYSCVEVLDSLLTITCDSYDIQLCFEVLEHVEKDVELMAEICSRGRTGSYFIGSVPAYMKKWQKVDDWAGHVRRYERAELKGKLETAGFEVVKLDVYGFPFTNLMYPFRQLHYRNTVAGSVSKQSATYNSGIDRKSASAAKLKIMYGLLSYLAPLQRVPILKNWGDGFIFLAKKR